MQSCNLFLHSTSEVTTFRKPRETENPLFSRLKGLRNNLTNCNLSVCHVRRARHAHRLICCSLPATLGDARHTCNVRHIGMITTFHSRRHQHHQTARCLLKFRRKSHKFYVCSTPTQINDDHTLYLPNLFITNTKCNEKLK